MPSTITYITIHYLLPHFFQRHLFGFRNSILPRMQQSRSRATQIPGLRPEYPIPWIKIPHSPQCPFWLHGGKLSEGQFSKSAKVPLFVDPQSYKTQTDEVFKIGAFLHLTGAQGRGIWEISSTGSCGLCNTGLSTGRGMRCVCWCFRWRILGFELWEGVSGWL